MKKINKDSLKKRNQKAFKNKVKRKNNNNKNKSKYVDIVGSLKNKGAISTLMELTSKTPNKNFGKGETNLTVKEIKEELSDHYSSMIVAGGISEILNYLSAKGKLVGEIDSDAENTLDLSILKVNTFIETFDKTIKEFNLSDDQNITQDMGFMLLEHMDEVIVIATYLEEMSKSNGLLLNNKDEAESIFNKILLNLENAKASNQDVFLNPYVYLFQNKLTRLEGQRDELLKIYEQINNQVGKFEDGSFEDIDVDNTLETKEETNE